MTDSPLIVAVGEVLWDVFPDGARLGGAPANFAVHCAALGARAALVSCVGDDPLGQDAVLGVAKHKVDNQRIYVDKAHPTGKVKVTLVNGQPSYQIVEEVAWDHILWCDELEALAKTANAICFGTLAQRAKNSRETIQKFVAAAREDCLCVLDVNFRQHYYSADVVRQSLALANVLKLNDEEVPLIRSFVGGVEDLDTFLDDLRVRYHLQWVVLTLGQGGCRVFGSDGFLNVESEPQKVVDTVGAGDAFTAAFIGHLLLGAHIETCAKQANAVGGFVVTQEGAMPSLPTSFRIFE
jgi:fructokinase